MDFTTPDKKEKQIQNLVHFITWQNLHLHSFIFLIRPLITRLTPKGKAVNKFSDTHPCTHIKIHSPYPPSLCPFPTH